MNKSASQLFSRSLSASPSPTLGPLLSPSDEQDELDFEQAPDSQNGSTGVGAGSASTLSSAEASFDRLLQGLEYRDRAKFAAYVRAEVDRDTPTLTRRHGLVTSSSSCGFVSSAYASLPVFWRAVVDRFLLLAGLLFLQSLSSLILAHFADFIQQHVVVTLYLTMLVGAGGNAGSQASVLVIRLLATSPRRVQPMAILRQEFQVAGAMGVMMAVVGFGRVYLFEAGDVPSALAITASLYVIVTASIVLGTALPLALHRLKLDPAHAGPAIQVIMDVIGVLATCAICSMVLSVKSA